jgi:hypothetical protein
MPGPLKVKPVSPQDLQSGIVHAAPGFVIAAFNELITENYVGTRSVFKQKDVIARIQKNQGVTQEEIFKSGWLNVEPHFRAAGWSVEYDKPGYNESYDAHFIFSAKK